MLHSIAKSSWSDVSRDIVPQGGEIMPKIMSETIETTVRVEFPETWLWIGSIVG